MTDADGEQTITVEVAYARPDSQRIVSLAVEPGTTLIQAVERSAIVERYPEIDLEAATFGVFGKVEKQRDRVLRDGDRVEIYRPLLIDPKAKRAKRAEAQKGERKAEQEGSEKPGAAGDAASPSGSEDSPD